MTITSLEGPLDLFCYNLDSVEFSNDGLAPFYTLDGPTAGDSDVSITVTGTVHATGGVGCFWGGHLAKGIVGATGWGDNNGASSISGGPYHMNSGTGDRSIQSGAIMPINEICDGVDNDGDEQVDEGFPDTDLDGIKDCVDTETCDGVDNDGDTLVDEGFPDTDGDGTADCEDVEECDGLDNDGDTLIDEGFPDTDGDGTADCEDTESCDGVDNNGNGQIDEGFPDTDKDGTPDCEDTETCDGVDNDGDGVVDEGFPDSDLDGALDCFDNCPNDPNKTEPGNCGCGNTEVIGCGVAVTVEEGPGADFQGSGKAGGCSIQARPRAFNLKGLFGFTLLLSIPLISPIRRVVGSRIVIRR